MIKENVSANAEDYMYDMAVVYGEILEQKIAQDGKAQALATGTLSEMFRDVKIKSAETSYAYITDGEGTMLYHPIAEKVGQPVENIVVKGLAAEIGQGKVPEPGITSYDFRGTIKYAAYYVGGNGNFILVISADESEIFSSVGMMQERAYYSGLFALVVCGLIGVILATLVVKPIKLLTNNVLKLSELDFTEDETQAKLDKRKDETGQMSHAVSVLREQLVRVIGQIREQSEHLYDAAEYLSGSATETSETVGQVERAVGEIADGAGSQAEETQKATENVILIGNMVEETSRQVEILR
ncbi:MAG: methyl-accepting chemotaxis protein, partial [Lachnospiraceae bacterium]